MRKTYINGVEVEILNYFNDHNNIASCRVRVITSGWIIDAPTSMIEIR